MSLLLIAAALVVPPPDADTACVLDRLSAERRAAIITEIATDGDGDAIDGVTRVAQECGRAHGWTSAAVDEFAIRAVVHIMSEDSEARLAGSGIPRDRVERWIESLPPHERRRDGLLTTSMDRLLAELVESGLSRQTVESAAGTIEYYVTTRFLAAEIPSAASAAAPR